MLGPSARIAAQAGLLTSLLFQRLPIPPAAGQWRDLLKKFLSYETGKDRVTAAGLWPTFTAFPFY